MGPARGGKPLERVAEHGPGHLVGVPVEKPLQDGAIPIARLPEHPTDGLVHEVLAVIEANLPE